MMQEFTQFVAQALVDHPESVKVETVDGERTSLLRLKVGPGETGKIIGRNGRTADALRTLLKAIATKERKRVVLEIEDELHRPAYVPKPASRMPLATRRKVTRVSA